MGKRSKFKSIKASIEKVAIVKVFKTRIILNFNKITNLKLNKSPAIVKSIMTGSVFQLKKKFIGPLKPNTQPKQPMQLILIIVVWLMILVGWMFIVHHIQWVGPIDDMAAEFAKVDR